jgi:hypothetical protein
VSRRQRIRDVDPAAWPTFDMGALSRRAAGLCRSRAAPPLLAQDMARVLGELLGMDARTLADLKQGGVL